MDRYQVEKLLFEHADDSVWDNWARWSYLQGEVFVKGLGVVSKVESDLGSESHGEELYFVLRIDNNDTTFWRKDGFYSSYMGSEWDGPLVQVYPVEKTITVFEEV